MMEMILKIHMMMVIMFMISNDECKGVSIDGDADDDVKDDLHSDDAETGAQCPGQHTGPSLGAANKYCL